MVLGESEVIEIDLIDVTGDALFVCPRCMCFLSISPIQRHGMSDGC